MKQGITILGVALIGFSGFILASAGNNLYEVCYGPRSGIGPAYDRCGSAEITLNVSLLFFVPMMGIGIWLTICGAKELSLKTLKKKA